MERIAGNKIFFFIGILIIVLLLNAVPVLAQQNSKPILDRSVTNRFSSQRTDLVLNEIARLGGFNFSYNPSAINSEKIISGNFTNTPVREVLIKIFGNSVEFREKKDYVILQKAKQVAVQLIRA